MNTNLTSVKATLTLRGYKAKLRFSKDGNLHVYVQWFHPDGTEIEDWQPYSEQLDLLLANVRDWVSDRPHLTLWSY